MKTFDQNQINDIVNEMNFGAVVAVPTETVYGLAARFDYEPGIENLTKIKKRTPDSGKIFTLMLENIDQISEFAMLNAQAKKVAKKYFPGELTLVLPKNPSFKNPYFDNFETIGIRIPNHKFMLDLLKVSGPLLVTSANLAGLNPAINSAEVEKNLASSELAELVVVTGKADGNPPSTVVDFTTDEPKILRQGGLMLE